MEAFMYLMLCLKERLLILNHVSLKTLCMKIKFVNTITRNCLDHVSKNGWLLIFFSILNTGWCQSTFQKGYRAGYDTRLVSVLQTSVGAIISAGQVFQVNKERMCLIKTDINGDTIWAKSYGDSNHYICKVMEQTSDHGFILAGRSQSTGNDSKITFMKTDSDGAILWSKTYNSPDFEEILDIKQTPAGDYFIAGYGFAGKMDAVGNMIWSKNLNTVNVNLFIRSIHPTYDGGLILAGHVDSLSPSYSYLLKMNGAGNIIWTKVFRSFYNISDEVYSVIQTSDKGFIMTGLTLVPVTANSSNKHTTLIKTDSLGNLTWAKKFGGDVNDQGYALKQTADGGYIVMGSSYGFTGNGFYSHAPFLLKTAADGSVTWCNYYGSAAEYVPASLSIANDGGYLVPGFSVSQSEPFYNPYLLKTDASGNVNCSGFGWNVYDSTCAYTSHSVNQTAISTTLTAANPVLNTRRISLNDYDICTVGLPEWKKDIVLKIYPNPNNGCFTLHMNHDLMKGKLFLINLLGQKVFEQDVYQGTNEIITSGLAKGLYHYALIEKNELLSTGKVILE
jgi:hypothetical protein